ncbi:ankyrin repeat domain-containing protein [Motiliproteus sp.]|uniref:ankyrin repeat domain-containing protein n=1 Tax=Motiliproteus sp. TaxID=1898955 RepID=UPI003BA8D31B
MPFSSLNTAGRVFSALTFALLAFCVSPSAQALSESEQRVFLQKVAQGDMASVRELVETIPSSKINFPITRSGGTLLHALLQRSRRLETEPLLQAMDLLLAQGVDINRRDDNNRTAVFYLVDHANGRTLIKSMEERGARLDGKDGRGKSLLHVFAASGNLEVVDYLLDRRAPLEAKDADGKTPLAEAVRLGQRDTVERLISAGADITTRDRQGNGLLLQAANAKNIQIADFLLDRGLPINQQNNRGDTALSRFASTRKWTAVRLLIERGADANVPFNNDLTVAQLIATSPQLGLEDLLEGKKVDINRPGRSGYTPMFQAIRAVDLKQIDRLLALGADVNMLDSKGTAPMLVLAERNPNKYPDYAEVVQRVLKEGAEINVLTDGSNQNAVLLAARRGYEEGVEILLENGADINFGQQRSKRQTDLLTALIRQGKDSLALLFVRHDARLDYDNRIFWHTLQDLAQRVEQEEERGQTGVATELFVALFDRKPTVNLNAVNRHMIQEVRKKLDDSDSINVLNSLVKVTYLNESQPSREVSNRYEKIEVPKITVPSRQYSPDSQLHVVGVYEGKSKSKDDGRPWWAKCPDQSPKGMQQCHRKMTSQHPERTVDITLSVKDSPVVLALMAYEPTLWRIKNSGSVKIDGVILAGFHGQRVQGLQQGVPVDVFTSKPSNCGDCQVGGGAFYAYKRNSREFNNSLYRLKTITGLTPTSFQGRYSGERFTILSR